MVRKSQIADVDFGAPVQTVTGQRRVRPPQVNFECRDEAMLEAFREAAHARRMTLSNWCRAELSRAAGYVPPGD